MSAHDGAPPDNASNLEDWFLTKSSLPISASLVGLEPIDKALVIARLHEKDERPLFVVMHSSAEARNLIDDLGFFLGDSERVHYLPSVEFNFHKGFLPNVEMLCERNASLFHILNDPKGRIFVSTLGQCLHKVIPPDEFLRITKIVCAQENVERDELIRNLTECGYVRNPSAYDPGTFAVRGGLIDIFCPLYSRPIRIEFFGDLIEEIRFYDPTTQRSLEGLDKAFIIPVGQTLLPHGKDLEHPTRLIKQRLDSQGIPKGRRDELIEKLKEGISTEHALLFPLLSNGSSSFIDYFPKETIVIWSGRDSTRTFYKDTEWPKILEHYGLFEKHSVPISERTQLFVEEEEFEKWLDRSPFFSFEPFAQNAPHEMKLQSAPAVLPLAETPPGRTHSEGLLEKTSERLRNWVDEGIRVLVVCHTHTHAERVQSLLEPYGLKAHLVPEASSGITSLLKNDFTHLHLKQGFVSQSRVYPKLHLALVSEELLFGHKKRAAKSAAWSTQTDRLLSSFRDLNINDYIVHKEHGIGRYLGLRTMNFQGIEGEFVVAEYRDNDKLYVPVYRLSILQKFVGHEGSPTLDKLGGDRFAKAQYKARKAIEELAAEFLNTHAKRKLIPAHAFSSPGESFIEFEMEFPFDETGDQLKAIEDVMHDMSQNHPMDRLVCGDVGYGKTEVAMRAAYRTVLDGKQVAILVPTTVLAFQHYETFKRRFKNTAVRIEMVSRLRSQKEIRETLKATQNGKVDILIGTHRLLSSDIRFKDLGVIIVDEEHRFGVIHKEKLKKLSQTVHVLSMTATPIPRTLNMAMSGIKDLSIITTPPPDRLSIRTFVCRDSPEIVSEAIQNELSRQGQVFFVHNRIESLPRVAQELRELFPKAHIEVVHGQMEGETIERKMIHFYKGEAQILLTTAIIESGLDIPRANTIIIDEAHCFGLAQLYQLRGRVGRSEKRAYCYLLIPAENVLSTEAKQRLQVIQRYSDLGGGFQIASHDLDIRGAGDLLGKEQSGHLNAIGIEMYFELLEDSIRALRGEPKKIEIEPEIGMRVPASFPQDYLPDISERIQLYRRLSSVDDEEAISQIEEEIRDRFGPLPPEAINLLGLMRLKVYLKRLHVVRMSCGPKRTSLQFAHSTPISPEKIIHLIQHDPEKRYALTPDHKLVFAAPETAWQEQIRMLQRLCAMLLD